MATHTIVTIVGSLRKESFSLKIANALAKLAPASLKLDVTTLESISFFNQDLEANPPDTGWRRIAGTLHNTPPTRGVWIRKNWWKPFVLIIPAFFILDIMNLTERIQRLRCSLMSRNSMEKQVLVGNPILIHHRTSTCRMQKP